MAGTAEGSALTEYHRAVQDFILASLVDRLGVGWGGVDPTNLRGTLDPWSVAARVTLLALRRASSSAALAYYMSFRRAEGVTGLLPGLLAPDPPPEVLSASTLGAGVHGIVVARASGASVPEAKARGFSRLVGSSIKVVADGGRETILGLVAGDAQAVGYQRVTDSDPCAFCRMLAGRGIIKYTRDSAAFQAHAHCGCAAEPAFEGSVISPQNAVYRDQWKAATRGRSDALNAFRRFLKDAPAMGASA